MSLTWTSWLTNTIQSDVYFLINTLSQPNPIKQFYINDWIEEAFPIYRGTALSHLSSVSPWLVKVKPSQYSHLGQVLDTMPLGDNSWDGLIIANSIGVPRSLIGKSIN